MLMIPYLYVHNTFVSPFEKVDLLSPNGGNAIIDILEPPASKKNSIHWVLEALCICLSFVSDCLCLFVSLFLGHCHRQMISFQKIYGLHGLEHHIVEMNGNFTMRDQ